MGGRGQFDSVPIQISDFFPATDSGDLDNDGDADLIAGGMGCSDCTYVWLLREGRLQGGGLRIFGENAAVHRLQIADLDADGDQDAVALVDVFEALSVRRLCVGLGSTTLSIFP
ncbi:MAG: hypothetical protein M2R45_01728 [Verrucomicrobia subdivision 3 bacterium]|nr:hypothetical protein [Limisphaerales bacterium]MCS1413465.1 hypothetical protein [Limisphaerales bacterium]